MAENQKHCMYEINFYVVKKISAIEGRIHFSINNSSLNIPVLKKQTPFQINFFPVKPQPGWAVPSKFGVDCIYLNIIGMPQDLNEKIFFYKGSVPTWVKN